MQALIAAGAGLAVGLALLTWALLERRARYQAELRTKDAQLVAKDLQASLRELQSQTVDYRGQIRTLVDDLKRGEESALAMRRDIMALRQRLLTSQDPKVVKKWVDDLLSVSSLKP